MAFEIGSTIGDYEIIQILGAGGMGKVYKVRNVISDRFEAMKVLLPNLAADHELADRFIREIKVQAKLDHPNIAALHTAQRVDNQLLMIMEFVEGQTLESVLKNRRIGLREGVDYVCQVLSALSYAHSHGVVHRDIKPANMMLTPEGVVKLMDFGIAKLAADRNLTQTGRTVGSIYYMSPEQIQGSTELGPRSDLYSLGVSLYEIVTGARPFQGDSDFSIMAAHLQQTPLAPIQYDPNLPAALNEVILMSIAKEPDKRFQSADAFRNALLGVTKDLPAVSDAENAAATVILPRLSPDAAPTRVSAPVVIPPQPAEARPVTSPIAVAAAPAASVASTSAAPQLPPSPPSVLAEAPPPKSARGLYMVVGSLATIAIIGAAIVEGPKLFKTQANTPAATPVNQSAPAPITQPVQQSPRQDVVEKQPALQQAPVQQMQRETAPEVQAPQSMPGKRRMAAPALPQAAQIPTQQPAPQQSTPPPSAPLQQTPAPVAQAPSIPDPATLKQLDDLRDRQSLMSVRMQTVLRSLKRLSEQQAASGLGPSPEMTSAADRMQVQFDRAVSQIRAGDAAGAKRSLDTSERELEKLEDRFGR